MAFDALDAAAFLDFESFSAGWATAASAAAGASDETTGSAAEDIIGRTESIRNGGEEMVLERENSMRRETVASGLYNQTKSCYCDLIGRNAFDADRDPRESLNFSR